MATSTSRSSPGVKTSLEAKFSWNALTPASVPAGARISAGKSGRVARSFPASADSVVNCMPVTCMPSPESPAKRITTRSRASTRLELLVAPSGIVHGPQEMRGVALLGRCARRPVMAARGTRSGIPRVWYRCNLTFASADASVDAAERFGLRLALLRIVADDEAHAHARGDLGTALFALRDVEEDRLPAVVAQEPEPLPLEEPIHHADHAVTTRRFEGRVVEKGEGGWQRTIRRRLR